MPENKSGEEPLIEIYSVGDEEGDAPIEDRLAGLLRMTKERATKGLHHTHYPAKVKKAEGDSNQGEEVEASSLLPEDSGMWGAFTKAGALEPPYSPDLLLELYRLSNSLRQNIDAYATNIDGFGYTLEPLVDLESDEAYDMAAAKLREEMAEDREDDEAPDLEDDKWRPLVEARLERLRRDAADEKVRIRNFFDFCGLEMSFIQLRKRTRIDLEIHGYGGWEVLRNAKGELAKFVHVPAHTLRIMPADETPRRVTEKQRTGPFKVEEVDLYRYFRRYVHWQGGDRSVGRLVYLKDWGDPRVVSRDTGKYYETIEELRQEEGREVKEAHELLYFDLHNPDSYYGENRWMGNLLSVLGSRESEEVNYLYFRNKSIPPMVLLISGGRVGKEDKEKIKDYIERELKGTTASFHRVMIITARSDPGSGDVPRMEFKPLTEALLNEGIFQSYDERNIDKVGSAFRLPRLLRGDIRDFNRATADAALRFTESQVFQGERNDFDYVMNRRVMTRLDARFWQIRSNPPPLQDPEAVVEMVEKLVKANIMTPAEARRQLTKVGVAVDVIDEPWTKRPAVFTLSGVGFEPEAGERVIQTPEIAQASEEEGAEGEVEVVPGSASPGTASEQGLRVLEERLFGKAGMEGLTPAHLQDMNRRELVELLRGAGIEDEEDLEEVIEAIAQV